ncbi:hypothetical protein Lal_00012071, partial [Lupinus albus]
IRFTGDGDDLGGHGAYDNGVGSIGNSSSNGSHVYGVCTSDPRVCFKNDNRYKCGSFFGSGGGGDEGNYYDDSDLDNIRIRHVSLPSWVTLACNPSGGIKVMEHGYGCARLGWWLHHTRGHSVRLVSQSSEHLWLLTVEGSHATVLSSHYSLASQAT